MFPSNFQPDLDFSVIETEEQLDRVIRRDFETKAPTGTDIMNRVEAGGYASRYELMRDVALNLFWVNRFALTMYDKYPVRWRDVTRTREDMFRPIVAPWIDREAKVEAVARGYRELPPMWDSASEDRIFAELFDVFRAPHVRCHNATSIKPTIAEALTEPASLTFTLPFGVNASFWLRRRATRLHPRHRGMAGTVLVRAAAEAISAVAELAGGSEPRWSVGRRGGVRHPPSGREADRRKRSAGVGRFRVLQPVPRAREAPAPAANRSNVRTL